MYYTSKQYKTIIYFFLSKNFTKILETLFWGIDDLQIMQDALESVFENYIQMGMEMVLLFSLYSAILVWKSILQLEG